MSFERNIVGDLPLAAASAFFLKLKTAAQAPLDPPDETGGLEGQFEAPVEQVLPLLVQMVENEFKTMYAYKTYAQSLRDLSHFAIAEEFEDHSEDEIEHADWLLRRLAVLGGPSQLNDIPAPPPATDPSAIINTMIRMEQEGIAKWRVLHSMLGENPAKYKVEEYLTKEQEHLDELWQMLPNTPSMSMQPMAAAQPPAAPQPQQRTPATNNPDASGTMPPAIEKKEAMAKFAEHVRVMRKRGSGNFDQHGDATAMMEDFLKNASAKMAVSHTWVKDRVARAINRGAKESRVRDFQNAMGRVVAKHRGPTGPVAQKADAAKRTAEEVLGLKRVRAATEKKAGIGGGYDWRPMSAIPGTAGDTGRVEQPVQQLQVQLPAIGSYTGKETTKADLSSPAPRRGGGGGGGGGDDMGLGGLDFGKEGSIPLWKKLAKADAVSRGHERADAGLAARARQTEGMRGELYGDVIGRILGATGGFYAGKPGGSLPSIAAAALGQHLGGKAGKTVGREVDTRRTKKKLGGIKQAFEDTMNLLGQEQMLQQQQGANEAAFYMERSRALAEQQKQMEQALQAAQQEKEQQAQQLAELQNAVQQQTQMSNDATTRALMQTVQANNSALQSRQLANDTTAALQKLKQTLREIAGDDSGSNTGGMGSGGEPATSLQQQGPAAQAPSAGNTPSAAPPEGGTTTPGPTESPDSGASGQPGRTVGQQDQNRPQTGDQFKSASVKDLAKGALHGAKQMLTSKAPYALGGAALMGGLQAANIHGGSEKLRQEVAADEKTPAGSFGEAMMQAQRKARLGLAEAGEKFPGASTAMAALGGASMGASLGPALVGRLQRAPGDIKTLMGG